MGECGILLSLLTLDNFYNRKTIKGKINLLIFLTFKVMAPVWPAILIGDDTVATYKTDMTAHYKVSPNRHRCRVSNLDNFNVPVVKLVVRWL